MIRTGRRASLAGILAACAMTGTAAAGAGDWPDRLEGHGGPIRGVAVAEDRPEALSGSFDYSVIHWAFDGSRAEIRHRLIGHEAAVNDIDFVAGTHLAVSASDDGTVGLWNLDDGTLVTRFAGTGDKVLDVDVAPGGRYAASAAWNGTARVFDLKAKAESAVMSGHDGNVNAVAFSTDGRHLFTGAYDGDIRMFDAASGELTRTVYSHGWGVNVVRAVPDGRLLLFGALDGTAGVIDIETGEVVRKLDQHTGPVLAADIAAEKELAVVAGADGRMSVYRLPDWAMEHDHTNPYGPIWATAITPDGSTVFYGGLDDFVIGLQIDPPLTFEPAQAKFPRRFQVSRDMNPGEAQFARKCSVCHTLTPDGANRAGPTLYKLFGRKAGSLPDYPYSEALRNSDIIWTEDTVAELFDHGPDVVTPGSKMPLQRLKDVKARDALISFLKRATDGDAEPETR